ncbi:MAG: Phytanoyl-CoA dioxygenase [Actinomycetia bacterium]|nr:Phytanoyl-CoA dioxygenase [Actinomycetes bacterium]
MPHSCVAPTRSLDVRTRSAGDMLPVSTVDFFDDELPERAWIYGGLAVPGALELRVAPFTIATPSGAWTLALDHDEISVQPGDTGAARVLLDDDDVASIVNDTATPMTLVASARLRMERGQLGAFLDWWVVLRSLIDARPVHTTGSITFLDQHDAPLDLARSFTPHDADADIAHFLAEAGFLHLEAWFDAGEMEAIDRDMDAAFEHYNADDGRSWWAETADGTARAVRLQQFEEHSQTLAALLADERFLRIGALVPHAYVARTTGEALEKPIGVVKGISDLPWHKDCSLGMHSYNCCGITVGISVTGADARSGQLSVVPGSHRALVQPAFHRREWGLPPRDLPTRRGDVTVHCSCTMHMSHAPVERERRVVYTGFGLPPREEVPLDMQGVRAVREEAYKKVSQPASRVAATPPR